MVRTFIERVPGASHFVHETVDDGPQRRAWQKIYGEDGELLPLLDQARIVVSLDADFMGTDGTVLESIASFARTRTLDDDNREAPAHGESDERKGPYRAELQHAAILAHRGRARRRHTGLRTIRYRQ